jgi:uracil-DNA glycosylase
VQDLSALDVTSESFGALPADWEAVLASSGAVSILGSLGKFVAIERQKGPVYPPAREVFRALELTPLASVRAVIVGQDPYHGEGQAHGLAFSVPDGMRLPPSLRNILVELERDCGIPRPASGSLEPWARRGVLLLNTVLTVGLRAGSHRGHGWEDFTGSVIRSVSDKREPVAFFLWGRAAGSLDSLIDLGRHVVIKAGHPSPFSARRFSGRAGFATANAKLALRGIEPIDWSLDDVPPTPVQGRGRYRHAR